MSQGERSFLGSARGALRFWLWRAGDRVRNGVLGRMKHGVWRRLVPAGPLPSPLRLHVGCGRVALEGWVNIDLEPLLAADRVLDVTRGMPFEDVDCIFAEHFLEHLRVDEALHFLRACRDALRDEGWIRLSTPNLDWVWTHVYRPRDGEEGDGSAARMTAALHANRSFYGWQHRFLWNRELLAAALRAAGFDDVRWCRYGESARPELRGLERHETYGDTEEVPHVLVVEARPGTERPRDMHRLLALMEKELLVSL